MLSARYKSYSLQFINPVLTSRGSMAFKNGYLIEISDGIRTGIGECSFIEGLSADNLINYESVLSDVCSRIQDFIVDSSQLVSSYPSIVFGVDSAMLDLQASPKDILFESDYTSGKKGIDINGLIWMGDAAFMKQQIEAKLEQGFKCLKLKVGALDFDTELKIIEGIRKRFSPAVIELRLDANGAFSANDVFEKLNALATFGIHSIEQPVKPGQIGLMHEICNAGIIDVALDEELIGIYDAETRAALLSSVQPQYIILKPSLLGGLASCNNWIHLAEQHQIGWWATSALESNIGLNVIAQWVAQKRPTMPQGLGTGSLYANNFKSKNYIKNGQLWFEVD